MTLEDIDECQGEASNINDRESDVICPSEKLLVASQGQVENEDGGFDGHECRVLKCPVSKRLSSRWMTLT